MSNNAEYVPQPIPKQLIQGEKRTVAIAMKNIGTTTWTQAGQYKLGTQNPQDNSLWTGDTRVYLSPSDAIAPGQTKTFTFEIQAPVIREIYSLDYRFQWRMVQDGVGWFGAFTPDLKINVRAEAGGVTFPIRPGLWPASEEESSNDDLDGDGLSQLRELKLAQAFFPTIWFDNGEDCTEPGGNGKRGGPNQPGRLVFRVRPHPENRDFLAITYSMLLARDCGESVGLPGGLNFQAHPGDVETFAITLAPNPGCVLGYGIFAIRTWAHEGVKYVEKIETADTLALRCNYGFSIDPVGRTDIVLVSENKHGSYLRDATCDAKLRGFENCDLDFTMGDVNSWVGFNSGEPSAPRHRDLGPLGFPGEELWAGKNFCGASPDQFAGCAGSPGPVEGKLNLFAPAVKSPFHAQFISQSVPNQMQSGETQTVSITMKNTGSLLWSQKSGNKLGSQNPQDNALWTGDSRIYLPPNIAIEPGQAHTFTFKITAPTTPGTYNFQWRMLQEDVIWFGDFTPNVSIEVKPGVPQPVISWEDDKFDGLAIGPLNNKNGWVATPGIQASAVVKLSGEGGNLLEVDPVAGATIAMGKDIADQASGLHSLSMRVRVTGATEASLAKIEAGTDAGTGWNKKFQVFFGNSMRVNYAKTGETITFVAATQMARWYAIRFDMDLDKNLLDVWVDGTLAADDLKMHPGPITALSLSGWDRTGAVSLDDLIGIKK